MKEQIGVCGVYCRFCPVFRLEQNRCFGCEWVSNQLKRTRENHKGCVFWECAQSKDVKSCFQCKEFPCETHYDPKQAVYTKQVLDVWKKLRETGFAS